MYTVESIFFFSLLFKFYWIFFINNDVFLFIYLRKEIFLFLRFTRVSILFLVQKLHKELGLQCCVAYTCVDTEIQNSTFVEIMLQTPFRSPFCIVFMVEEWIAEWVL